jgi:hypothetical protein
MTVKLPPPPRRIASLPKDERGYPVPWFVAWLKDGRDAAPSSEGAQPDFRIVAPGRFAEAYLHEKCWICGQPLGRHKVYTIGPMCVINRVTSEPASHRECAEFAAQACPFLTHPRRTRDDRDLPPSGYAGIAIKRNPGVVCLYETSSVSHFRAGPGYLLRLGAPTRVDWYAEGRKASRPEVIASIESGYPILLQQAARDGPEAVVLLSAMRDEAMQHLPAAMS